MKKRKPRSGNPLDLPEEHPPTEVPPELLLVLRTESTWTGDDSDEIKLIADSSDNSFYLEGIPRRRKQPNSPLPRPPMQRINVSEQWVNYIFMKLETTSIPIFPKPEMGFDGGFMELEIGGYEGKATYRWWNSPPAAWEPLHKIATVIYYKFYDGVLYSR